MTAGLAGALIADVGDETVSSTARPESTSTSSPALTDLSDEELADAWQDAVDDLTGELRGKGFPNPKQIPYEPTGTDATAALVMAAYFERDTGDRATLLDLWDATEGRVPYVDQELRGRIQSASDPDDLWSIVADIAGRVIAPLTGSSGPTAPSSTSTTRPTTTTTRVAPPTTTAPPPPTTADPYANETAGQSNARAKAADYLDLTAFSRSGLIKQLQFEGYSATDATYGVDALHADWNKQAARKAAEYLELTPFSRSGLIEQLKFEGFTQAQAEYGVSTTGL